MLTRMPTLGEIVQLTKTKWQEAVTGRVVEIKKDGVVVLEVDNGERAAKRASFVARYVGGNLSKFATIKEH